MRSVAEQDPQAGGVGELRVHGERQSVSSARVCAYNHDTSSAGPPHSESTSLMSPSLAVASYRIKEAVVFRASRVHIVLRTYYAIRCGD